MLKKHAHTINSCIPQFFLAVATALFFLKIFPYLKSYPYADDWALLTPLCSKTNFIQWLFQLHNDHRIPIQKFLQVAMLKFSGIDYRSLALLNFVICYLTAICWMKVAQTLRSDKGTIGDLLIPCLILSPGFNALVWGFNFQFIASNFFVALAMLLWIGGRSNSIKYGEVLSFLSLTLCSWTGGNGVISSSIIGAILFILSIIGCFFLKEKIRLPLITAFILLAATNIGIALSWQPSSASSAADTKDYLSSITFAIQMFKSWMGVAATTNQNIKLILSLFILVGAVTSIILAFKLDRVHRHQTIAILATGGSALSVFFIIIVVALSRAKTQPWWPGLELHYGLLTLSFPIASWIIISTVFRRHRLFHLGGFLFSMLMIFLYCENAYWRISSLRESWTETALTQAALLSETEPKTIVNQHIRELNYTDSEESKTMIENAIKNLWSIHNSLWDHNNN